LEEFINGILSSLSAAIQMQFPKVHRIEKRKSILNIIIPVVFFTRGKRDKGIF
jgi:hypothetical protein